MGDKEEMGWMYSGPSSIVNRDSYLEGKKVDRNYELFCGEQSKEKPSGVESVLHRSPRDTKSEPALLDLDTVKKEDPLVAIKVKEEKLRLEILENPLRMKRLQKIVVSAMEKKMKKMLKEQKKEELRRKASPSPRRESDRRLRRRRDSSESPPRNERRRSREPSEHRPHSASNHLRRPSSTAGPTRPSKRYYSDSESEEEGRRKAAFSGYGLVKRGRQEEESEARSEDKVKLRQVPSTKAPPSGREEKKKKPMTEEEKERRRKEMTDNARWRQEQRDRNLRRYDRIDKEEKKRDTKQAGEAADFIRPMLSRAAERGSLESRIKSNIHNIQRGYGSMDSNFARK